MIQERGLQESTTQAIRAPVGESIIENELEIINDTHAVPIPIGTLCFDTTKKLVQAEH